MARERGGKASNLAQGDDEDDEDDDEEEEEEDEEERRAGLGLADDVSGPPGGSVSEPFLPLSPPPPSLSQVWGWPATCPGRPAAREAA